MEPVLSHISKNQVRFIRSLQQKKVRDEEELFVAEGDKCIGELLGHFDLVLYVRQQATDDRQLATGNRESLPLYSPTPLLASPSELSQMSSLKTPQDSLAVFKQKSDKLSTNQQDDFSKLSTTELDGFSKLSTFNFKLEQALVLALDGIQDPGNLGTIIRTADWFGITDIYCSNDTADCYNPKVVQATMGALARVSIHYIDLVEWLTDIRHSRNGETSDIPTPLSPYSPTPIYGTLLDGRNIYEKGSIEDPTRGIIIMGNEGNGISAEVREFITHPLYMPSYTPDTKHQTPDTHIESLNVAIATAITLAEFRRQFTTK